MFFERNINFENLFKFILIDRLFNPYCCYVKTKLTPVSQTKLKAILYRDVRGTKETKLQFTKN